MTAGPLPFSEFHPGREFATPEREVTAEDIRAFAELSEDRNPLHTDPGFARATRFGDLIAHGAFTFSILTGLWDRAGFMSGTVDAFVGVDRLRFLRPVRAGDRLRARLRVLRIEPRSHGGLVTFENELLNQRDEAVLDCETVLLLRDAPPAAARS
jgi:3-hydroxybutyryl-CoA dehydratase